MKLSKSQLRHLVTLRISDAVHEHSKIDRREWRWRPVVNGPLIRSSSLFALQARKLARWMPAYRDDLPVPGGRMIITPAGKRFLDAFNP
jgi:hypothetical protein